MTNIIFTEQKEREGKKLFIYQAGRYEVKKIEYEDGYTSIDIRRLRTARDEYLPEIYVRDTYIDTKLTGFSFEVQTTSYGALEVDELQKVIAGLQEAAEVAQALTNKFGKR